MSELIAISYPDQATVERARENLRKGVEDGVIEVEDAVVMIRDEDGTLEVRQGSTGVGGGAVQDTWRGCARSLLSRSQSSQYGGVDQPALAKA